MLVSHLLMAAAKERPLRQMIGLWDFPTSVIADVWETDAGSVVDNHSIWLCSAVNSKREKHCSTTLANQTQNRNCFLHCCTLGLTPLSSAKLKP